jgi:murein DD-endopeptidase MepM/ murein hydrolase activator NlpD
MPAGTEIRAARGGTVEWLQENLTPFPGGSLQNWGNAVRLRHAGGFTSWYFHIQANGVLVNVGDEVRRTGVSRWRTRSERTASSLRRVRP